MNAIRSLSILISRVPPPILVALIVGIAGLLAFVITGDVERQKVALKEQAEKYENERKAMATVVVAVKDVPEGKTISSEYLEEKQIPAGTVPADALTSAAMASGRISKYGISQGQIVSQHDLAPIGITLGFEARLKPGMRAITFAVDTNSGVAGFITPESRVDVMSMVGSGAETKVAPILSDVEVIAVGQMYHKDPGASQAVPVNSVTVAISPEDAQKLVKGVAASKLYLAMRSQGDHIPLGTVDVTSLFPKKLSDEDSPQIAQVPLPPPGPPIEAPEGDLGNLNFESGARGEAAKNLKPNHEIEMWTGSAKQVVELPKL